MIERCGIDERLESRTGLAESLYGPVELATRVVVAAYHGAHVAGVGVESQKRALGIRILVQRHFEGAPRRYDLLDFHQHDVAGVKAGGRPAARPRETRRGENCFRGADAQAQVVRGRTDDQRFHARTASRAPLRQCPLLLLEKGRGVALGEPPQRPAIAAAPIEGLQAGAYGALGDPLHAQVERSVDPQAELVGPTIAVAILEQAAHVLEVVGSVGVRLAPLSEHHVDGNARGIFALGVRDVAVRLHAVEHVELAGAGAVFVVDR